MLGSLTSDLGPFESIQVNRVLSRLTDSEIHNARARLVIESDCGRVATYASSIDNPAGVPVMQTPFFENP